MGGRRRASAAVALLSLLCGACELTEVATPEGSDVLVVEAILRPDLPLQRVLLHRTLNGAVVRGADDAEVVLQRVGGAEVPLALSRRDLCTDRLFQDLTDSLRIEASCFATSTPVDLVPGATYELRVRTPDGRLIRGRTTLPGDFQLRVPAVADEFNPICALEPGTNLPLTWSQSEGAWSYLIALEIFGLRGAVPPGIDAPERLELTGLAISQTDTTISVPGEVGLFELGTVDQDLLLLLRQGFPRGTAARVVVVAADRNYVNGVRGGAFNPSGSVRISSVVGDGVGVFGSAIARELRIDASGESEAERCNG